MNKTRRYSIRLSEETYKALRTVAQEKGITVAGLLRKSLRNTVLAGVRELSEVEVQDTINYYRDCLDMWSKVARERQTKVMNKIREVDKLSVSP